MAEPFLRRPLPDASELPGEADLPYEDDEPLAESDYQLEPLDYAYNGLSTWFQDRPDVAVQADMFVHYLVAGEDGGREHRMLAPDVFVIFGVPKRQRFSYVVWKEGKAPDFVLEILSSSTWRRDTVEKKAIYAAMGVSEYWLLDPLGPFLAPPLIGYRLTDGQYVRIDAEPGTTATYVSDVLELELRIDDDDRFRIRDPASAIELRSHGELQDELTTAVAARQRAMEARQRAMETRQRAMEARQRAMEALQRETDAREAAEQRAAEAERRLADLEARLRRESG